MKLSLISRCGVDNCQLFRSWADPKADCCVFAWQLPTTPTTKPAAATTASPIPAILKEYDERSKTVDLEISSEDVDSINGVSAWMTAAIEVKDDGRLSYQFIFDTFDVPGGDEACPDAWVMILEGDTSSTNAVILNKTCDANKDINLLQDLKVPPTSFSNATIYFKNNLNGKFKITRRLFVKPKTAFFSKPRCMWDCQWKENPFFSKVGFWRLGGWGDRNQEIPQVCGPQDRVNCIKVYFSLPQIPKDLMCLKDCFEIVQQEICNEDRSVLKCLRSPNIVNFNSTSDDKDIDCLLDLTKEKPRDDPNERHNHIQANDLSELEADRVTPSTIIRRKRRATDIRQTDANEARLVQTVSTNKFWKLIPTEPLEMALMFCIMANLDARRRLPSLKFPTREYYRGASIWNQTDCSSFFPKSFADKSECDVKKQEAKVSNSRLFGPASSPVAREYLSVMR